MDLHFISLDCPACGSAMRGSSHDILFVCTHCGAAAVLGENGLDVLEAIALLPLGGRTATTWRPAWLLDTNVLVDQRWVADGPPSGASRTSRSFIIPAFDLPFSDLFRLATALLHTENQPAEVPREPIRGGTLNLADTETIIRHLIIGEEVHKPDILVSVEVAVTINATRLAALPFEERDGHLVCAITGVKIAAAAT